uniref:ISRm3 transposase n=1 Tax=Rhizobium meliloti TaxID=382 RepID=I2E295_RHIML|nr:ISRm3 transposase [Sinorhizobium meliloti]
MGASVMISARWYCWGQKSPAIAQSCRNWEHVVPFFAFPEGVRRIIYTTNAIEE